jgi:hypothetical protein
MACPELTFAAEFWISTLDSRVSPLQKEAFRLELQSLMSAKFRDHWYEGNPGRGQSLRVMVCNPSEGVIDPMLVAAGTKANFDFFTHFKEKTGATLWVDPGEVEAEPYNSPQLRKQIYPEPRQVQMAPYAYDNANPSYFDQYGDQHLPYLPYPEEHYSSGSQGLYNYSYNYNGPDYGL